MSFGFTGVVRPRTHAAHAGAGWWRSAFGVASVAIALLLGLPAAARAGEQSLGSPTASPDDGAAQHPPEAHSAAEVGGSRDDDASPGPPEGRSASEPRFAGDDQATDAGELDDEDADGEASDAPAPPESSDDDARAPAWQARAASGTAAASQRDPQVGNDSDDHEDAAAGAEVTPAAPRVAGNAAVPPALRQRLAALSRRADRDTSRTTTSGRTSRSASAPHATWSGASTATPATQITTSATTPASTAHESVRTRPSKPDKQVRARASARQRTTSVPPPSHHGAQTPTTATVASGSSAGAFGASPVTGGLIAWALATSAIWFVLRERAHRLHSLLWAAPLERPG